MVLERELDGLGHREAGLGSLLPGAEAGGAGVRRKRSRTGAGLPSPPPSSVLILAAPETRFLQVQAQGLPPCLILWVKAPRPGLQWPRDAKLLTLSALPTTKEEVLSVCTTVSGSIFNPYLFSETRHVQS